VATLPARTLALTRDLKEWLTAQEKTYKIILKMCKNNPEALTIAYTYHASMTEAVPPQELLAYLFSEEEGSLCKGDG
jgi:hypothetical protein